MNVFIHNQATIKNIIFDFDGTLAKLNIDFSQMRKAVWELISSRGISRHEIHTDYVLEMIESVKDFLMQQSPDTALLFSNEAYAIIEDIEIEAAKNATLFKGTKELLNALKTYQIACGIITRNCSRAVKIVFPDISSYCSVVICRDHVKKVKPHADHLNMALSQLGGSPDKTLMIGDHPLDIKTGRNAGSFTCGVLTGRCQKNDFIEAGADIILNQACDILHIINGTQK